MLKLERPEWMADAACIGKPQAWFFPGRGELTSTAKNICAGCPVLDTCREYALGKGEQHGIWGGMSERERRRVRSMRAKTVVIMGPVPDRTRSAEILAYVENLRRQGYHDYIQQAAGHFGIDRSGIHKQCNLERERRRVDAIKARGAA